MNRCLSVLSDKELQERYDKFIEGEQSEFAQNPSGCSHHYIEMQNAPTHFQFEKEFERRAQSFTSNN